MQYIYLNKLVFAKQKQMRGYRLIAWRMNRRKRCSVLSRIHVRFTQLKGRERMFYVYFFISSSTLCPMLDTCMYPVNILKNLPKKVIPFVRPIL